MEAKMLKIGKLDSKLLEDIVFENIKFKRKEVLQRPGIGADCAVVDFGQYECVMSTDPITAAIGQIGKLAIHISCNDIASNGVEPLGIMLAVMLPVGTTENEVREMMKQAGETSAELGVEIIGGHTEITHAVNQPVIVSTAIGRGFASSEERKVKQGDLVFMTKTAGLEGTGIIACDYEMWLAERLTDDEIAEAKSFLNMVSVVKEGVLAGKIGFSAMHDVTEGGVLGAIWELCYTAGLGAKIYQDEIPISKVTKKICEIYEIDPLKLISSGCMLIIADPKNKEKLMQEMKKCDIQISLIGEVTSANDGIRLVAGGTSTEILPPESDEIYKAVNMNDEACY
jgi:hydrogenase expression/formation protein HypE